MAISHTYCDWATGNDYKGATFTDGSFDNATLTLTKTGAFAASRVNHWLYLDDNGSGEVASGYYRITTVTSDDAVVLDADIRSGANDPTDVVCTQHDGTTSLPWRSVQGAVDLCTRGATGDQVNIKAGTAQVLSAPIDLTTLGVPEVYKPLLFSGYTAVADDAGVAEIDCGGNTFFVTTYTRVSFKFLEIHSFGDADGIVLGNYGSLLDCEVHKGASNPVSRTLVKTTVYGNVQHCYIHDPGSGNAQALNAWGNVGGNYVTSDASGTASAVSVQVGFVHHNIILVTGNSPGLFVGQNGNAALNNIVYSAYANTKTGIDLYNGLNGVACLNNIVVGFSGVGGIGIRSANSLSLAGHNAFYNNTANYAITGNFLNDLSLNDVALAADPFVDAANGDFSLTPAAKAALAGKGFPTEYLGAHANTVPNITIGAIQQVLATSGGGFPKIASVLGRTRM